MTLVALLSPEELSALGLSIQVGLAATLLSLPFALVLAFWLARSRSRWTVLIDALVIMPMILPPVVVGYLLLIAFGRQGFIGAFLYEQLGLSLAYSWSGAALAAGILAFPLMVRSMREALESVDPGLEEAAATLGAGRLRVFFSISMPLAYRGILAGCSLAFARALGEFGATITFAGNLEGETRTLPLAIYSAMQEPGQYPTAWRLTCLSIALSLTATILCELLLRRQRRERRR